MQYFVAIAIVIDKSIITLLYRATLTSSEKLENSFDKWLYTFTLVISLGWD